MTLVKAPAGNYAHGSTLFDMSVPGRRGVNIPDCDVPLSGLPPDYMLRGRVNLPEVSQLDVVRYFMRLAGRNFSIESGFYPLGSCTMKYNPKINDELAQQPGFAWTHPNMPEKHVQGNLELLYDLQDMLTEITGMNNVALTPMGGAQGELTGALIIKRYHESRGDTKRRKMLVPDSAHGTNPATAAMAGYDVVTVHSNANGNTDLDTLRSNLGDDVAGLMFTYPSTLGLADPNILTIADMVHKSGGLMYCDGANMNAIVGQARPGDLGFDVMHMNLHKTTATPHGGGGPGAGPVSVKAHLADFLPYPVVERDGDVYRFAKPAQTIGRMGNFFGNFGILVRSYAYLRSLGAEGLKDVSTNAVINANYIRASLEGAYDIAVPGRSCMHEVVIKGTRQKQRGVRTLAIAKRLIDYGFHPPTIYFPLTVEEAMMIEPTETESKETLDAFINAMLVIDVESQENPDVVLSAPHTAPVSRLDEARAARNPDLRWRPAQ